MGKPNREDNRRKCHRSSVPATESRKRAADVVGRTTKKKYAIGRGEEGRRTDGGENFYPITHGRVNTRVCTRNYIGVTECDS